MSTVSYIRTFIFLLLVSGFEFLWIENANSQELTRNDCAANLVFDSAEGKLSTIMLQTFSDGQWSEPSLVFESSKILGFNPVVASDIEGNRLVVWPVNVKGRTRIKYRVKLANDSWENEANYLIEDSGESTTPVVLSNLKNDIWLAWASDKAGLDDIFLARWNNGVWSTPEMVNKTNDVPDIIPTLSRVGGNIILNWRSYDRSTRDYIEQSKIVSSYALAAKRSELVSNYCDSINYMKDHLQTSSGRLYLNKADVISDNIEVLGIP